MVDQERRLEQLEQELEQARAELAQRNIAINEAGTMAGVVLTAHLW